MWRITYLLLLPLFVRGRGYHLLVMVLMSLRRGCILGEREGKKAQALRKSNEALNTSASEISSCPMIRTHIWVIITLSHP
ncbi:uncharacterized protein F4812DRAFT_423930 [Daldinia caldariorum]|uniref:uncharacterized protein n=1 Tax=Daldinia caldariorum TaxID=326644 RepID=UPI002007D129|nr:uncharacterized protein F4812DRAFT_423930 [Daldinia caldariorum]KAI1468634.1 hypothetical protein F4812DRAFT_423930 [Daldinia caldariorum]